MTICIKEKLFLFLFFSSSQELRGGIYFDLISKERLASVVLCVDGDTITIAILFYVAL